MTRPVITSIFLTSLTLAVIASTGAGCEAPQPPKAPGKSDATGAAMDAGLPGVIADGGVLTGDGGVVPSGNVDGGSTSGTSGCKGLAACLAAAQSLNEAKACDAKATPQATMLFDAVYQCGDDFCLGKSGVAARCKLDANQDLTNLDGTPPFDANGPSGDCGICLVNSTAGLDGLACMPANDPACNPAKCAPAVAACYADLP